MHDAEPEPEPRTVAVRGPGRHEVEPLGEPPVRGALLIGVIGMVDLEAGHPCGRHPLDQLLRHRALVAPHTGMRQDAGAARLGDQRQRVERVEGVLRHVRDPAVGDEPIERLLLRRHDAGFDHRLREMGPRDQVVAGDRADAFEGHVVAELLELLHHQLAAPEPGVAQPPELLSQAVVLGIGPVRQDVERRAVVFGAELDPGNDL